MNTNEPLKDLTPNEKKIVDLHNNKEFQNEISEIQNNISSTVKEDRINKIKSILSKKGIEYTDEDAELFNRLIEYATEKKIKLGVTQLNEISGGSMPDQKENNRTPGPTIEDLTGDTTIYDLPGNSKRKATLISWAILGTAAAVGFAAGAGFMYFYKK